MTNITNLTTSQLSQILAIKEKIESLQAEIESIAGGGEVPTPFSQEAPSRGRRSAAVKARMSAAAKARWAKIKGTGATSEPVKGKRKLSASHRRKLIKALAKARKIRMANLKEASTPKKRRMSKAGRAAISAAAKARWAKARLEGKTRL